MTEFSPSAYEGYGDRPSPTKRPSPTIRYTYFGESGPDKVKLEFEGSAEAGIELMAVMHARGSD